MEKSKQRNRKKSRKMNEKRAELKARREIVDDNDKHKQEEETWASR